MAKQFLDSVGLGHLWSKIKSTFATKKELDGKEPRRRLGVFSIQSKGEIELLSVYNDWFDSNDDFQIFLENVENSGDDLSIPCVIYINGYSYVGILWYNYDRGSLTITYVDGSMNNVDTEISTINFTPLSR